MKQILFEKFKAGVGRSLDEKVEIVLTDEQAKAIQVNEYYEIDENDKNLGHLLRSGHGIIYYGYEIDNAESKKSLLDHYKKYNFETEEEKKAIKDDLDNNNTTTVYIQLVFRLGMSQFKVDKVQKVEFPNCLINEEEKKSNLSERNENVYCIRKPSSSTNIAQRYCSRFAEKNIYELRMSLSPNILIDNDCYFDKHKLKQIDYKF